MMLTVVIPAHQESAVIGACLSSLVRQDCEPGVQVVVVANGCTDGTAAVAQTYADALAARGLSLEVLVLPRAGKPAALNAGDLRAAHADRVYVDADVELSDNALSSIAHAIAAGVDFCGPTIVPRAQTYFGRVYGRVWRRLPYVAGDVVGDVGRDPCRRPRRERGQGPAEQAHDPAGDVRDGRSAHGLAGDPGPPADPFTGLLGVGERRRRDQDEPPDQVRPVLRDGDGDRGAVGVRGEHDRPAAVPLDQPYDGRGL
ncbi:MAG: glycosyltransferase, partial [Actinobacteria bacterium]|nr:glycosyltransferase [Actinomycetota bacterium]